MGVCRYMCVWWHVPIWPNGLANRLKLNPSQRTNYGHHSGSSCSHRQWQRQPIPVGSSRDLSPHLSPGVLWLNSINAARHAAECRPKMMATFRIGRSVKGFGFGSWKWMEVNLSRSNRTNRTTTDRCENITMQVNFHNAKFSSSSFPKLTINIWHH